MFSLWLPQTIFEIHFLIKFHSIFFCILLMCFRPIHLYIRLLLLVQNLSKNSLHFLSIFRLYHWDHMKTFLNFFLLLRFFYFCWDIKKGWVFNRSLMNQSNEYYCFFPISVFFLFSKLPYPIFVFFLFDGLMRVSIRKSVCFIFEIRFYFPKKKKKNLPVESWNCNCWSRPHTQTIQFVSHKLIFDFLCFVYWFDGLENYNYSKVLLCFNFNFFNFFFFFFYFECDQKNLEESKI